MCSIRGDAIDRIAEAIDQVASDARGVAEEPELTARVAEIWEILGALDPELARRQRGYALPADDTPRPVLARGRAPGARSMTEHRARQGTANEHLWTQRALWTALWKT